MRLMVVLFALPAVGCGLLGTPPGGGADAGFPTEGTVGFAPVSYVDTPLAATTLGAADFNRDGTTDVALGDGNGGFSVLVGTGTGSFRSLGGDKTNAIRTLGAGDLDGDQNPDLILATATLDVYRGLGNGSFAPSSNLTYSADTLLVHDLDGDRRMDVALAGGDFNTGKVIVLVQSNSQPVSLSVPAPSAIGAGDLNGDGRVDLVVASNSAIARRAQIVLAGSNGFSVGTSYALNTSAAVTLAVADFTGSSALDVAVPADQGRVALLVGQGDGTFTAGPSFASTFSSGVVLAMVAADFNGGGRADIAVLVAAADGSLTLDVLQRVPGAGFQLPLTVARFPAGQAVAATLTAADVDRDRRPDLLVMSGSRLAVALNRTR